MGIEVVFIALCRTQELNRMETVICEPSHSCLALALTIAVAVAVDIVTKHRSKANKNKMKLKLNMVNTKHPHHLPDDFPDTLVTYILGFLMFFLFYPPCCSTHIICTAPPECLGGLMVWLHLVIYADCLPVAIDNRKRVSVE